MHGFRRYIAFTLVVAGLTLALAGCSGSGGNDTSDDPSAGGATTYVNDQYGFSLTYDDQFSQGEPAEGTGAGGSSVFDVVFADKDGATVSSRYVNAIQVSVYELARKVTPSEVKKLESELQTVVDEMMSSLPSAEIIEPLSAVEVNGVPGFALKYTYSEDGTDLTAVTFFLVKGENEYQITAQSTTEDWNAIKDKLDAAVKSFKAS